MDFLITREKKRQTVLTETYWRKITAAAEKHNEPAASRPSSVSSGQRCQTATISSATSSSATQRTRLTRLALTLDELAEGRFAPVLDDAAANPASVRRVVMPSRRLPRYWGRGHLASPAPGSHKTHVAEQEAITV